jgi:protein MPE1
MSSIIHFKFKNSKKWDKIHVIFSSQENVKNEIFKKQKNDQQHFDLVLTNAGNGIEYNNPDFIIPKNVSLYVKRIPIYKHKPIIYEKQEYSKEELAMLDLMKPLTSLPPSKKQKHSPPPDGYVCKRCNVKGHYIQKCPTNNDETYDFKKLQFAHGIPKEHLKTVKESTGAFVREDGTLVEYVPNSTSFNQFFNGVKQLGINTKIVKYEQQTQPNLLCGCCFKKMKSPVFVECCISKFCNECIRQRIIENYQCPVCKSSITFKNLKINKYLQSFLI